MDQALQDDDAGARSNVAMVLGRIGDPETAPALIAIAADPKSDRGVRAIAITSLGQMRTPVAAALMQKLLYDPTVSANAVIALYRITGKKVAQFPAGYNAD